MSEPATATDDLTVSEAAQEHLVERWRRMHVLDIVMAATEFTGWVHLAGLLVE